MFPLSAEKLYSDPLDLGGDQQLLPEQLGRCFGPPLGTVMDEEAATQWPSLDVPQAESSRATSKTGLVTGVTHTCRSPGAGGEQVEGGGEPGGARAGVQGERVASTARRKLCHVFSVLLFPRMREVDLGCGKALLIKESGEFHAVGHKCPHYGAPLVKGQSASLPRRLTKGIKVLAKDSLVFIWLRCWAWGSVMRHAQHRLGIFSLGEGMSRELGVHKPPGSTSPQIWFAGDPSLPLLVTGLGLLWVTLKNKMAWAPLNLASASFFSWS